MRRYLSTLHKRSDRHKHNFALLVAGGTTLLMFSLWLTFRYEGEPVLAQKAGFTELAATKEVGPLDSLSASVGDAWESISENLGGLFDNLGSVDVEQGYEQMKTESFNTYGPVRSTE